MADKVFLLIVQVPAIFLLAFSLLSILALSIGDLTFSYLAISPEGLEYRKWLNWRVRCAWKDVDYLGTYRYLGVFSRDAIYLKQAQLSGWSVTVKSRRILGLDKQAKIPLSSISGWNDGGLASELRKYAPQLFSGQEK